MSSDLYNNYLKGLEEEEKEELQKSDSLIQDFIKYAAEKDIKLTIDNFKYSHAIGIIAIYPNILLLLNDIIDKDKEQLFDFNRLETEFDKIPFSNGYFKAKNFILMANSFFRRSYYEDNNFAPRFIELFWQYNVKQNKKYISLDINRVRIDMDDRFYQELDTWFGAKFQRNIFDIEDGIVKLRPPLDIDWSYIDSLFGDTYSLDIKWSSKDGVKVFQSEEFKTDDKLIDIEGKEFHPVRYIHAEFDMAKGCFRHFDGAIHFYTPEEYYQRRDSDFNYNDKNSVKLKSFSQKMFKINGEISIDDWLLLSSHYMSRNPLVFEYFEGKLPNVINDKVEFIRSKMRSGNL